MPLLTGPTGPPCTAARAKRQKDSAIADELKGLEAEIYVIEVSFSALKDKAELDYLNGLPMSFVLPAEAVDHLHAAAAAMIMVSSEFQRLLKETRAKMVPEPSSMDRRAHRRSSRS
jgi:NTE family protein